MIRWDKIDGIRVGRKKKEAIESVKKELQKTENFRK
jgi:hypothetical protein